MRWEITRSMAGTAGELLMSGTQLSDLVSKPAARAAPTDAPHPRKSNTLDKRRESR
jgi:hypothetical protein